MCPDNLTEFSASRQPLTPLSRQDGIQPKEKIIRRKKAFRLWTEDDKENFAPYKPLSLNREVSFYQKENTDQKTHHEYGVKKEEGHDAPK